MAARRKKPDVTQAPGIRTQADLAEAAGVSRYTVNRALRGLDDVSESTRKRIVKLASDRGYRVHHAASSMVKKRFNCVALIQSTVPYRSSLFDGSLFDGVHDALAEHDIHVVVNNMPDAKLLAEGELPKVLRHFMCDGLLMNYFAQIPPQLEQVLKRSQVRAVWMNTRRKDNCVYLDDVDGGRRATEYLLDLGHRRVGYLDYENHAADPIHHSIDDRYAGYRQAMRAAGLEPLRLRPSDEPLERGGRVAFSRSWLQRDDRPTAVVCYSNKSAMPLLAAACELDVDVPGELSVITFDDHAWLPTGRRLTTFCHGWRRVGRAAADQLRALIEDAQQTPRRPVVLQFEFEDGGSTAPAR
jgi:LacI family transcriptional regulator